MISEDSSLGEHQPPLTGRAAGFVEVSEARTDWVPDPHNPLPKFSPQCRVSHGVTLIGIALEQAFAVANQRPPGF
jgi:hypothetical protein